MKRHALISALVLFLTSFGLLHCSDDSDTENNNPQGDADSYDISLDGEIPSGSNQDSLPYAIVDTGQTTCFDAQNSIPCPVTGATYFGQDAQYEGNEPRYVDNGDGTVSDQVTGLMWQQDPGAKMTYAEAVAGADSFSLAGYNDWRVPTIKELYSLILFSGRDVDPTAEYSADMTPFIDDDAFGFSYGDTTTGDRIIDSQWVTSNIYLETVMGGEECFFGVNFADGRIKCYPTTQGGKGYFVIYVRGGSNYGTNAFTDNDDGTISDAATGLMWQQSDNGDTMLWSEALAYCEALELAGYDDWKLPNAKELQSLVDYSRSPGTSNSAAINPVFQATGITNEAGESDFGWYWSSSTHANQQGGTNAAYVAFGRALGYMNDTWMDVHGAGCQRSDPKTGDPTDYPTGHGPQGDAIRIYNFVRCVRGQGTLDENPSNGGDEDNLVPGDEDPDTNENTETTGPVTCTVEADCQAAGACPEDAQLGCTCSTTPDGKFCVPTCNTTEDCPNPPDRTLICGTDNLCVPQE